MGLNKLPVIDSTEVGGLALQNEIVLKVLRQTHTKRFSVEVAKVRAFATYKRHKEKLSEVI